MFLIVFIFIGFSLHAQHSSRELFTENWLFKLGEDTSGNWRTLNLPHDWSIEGTFDPKHPASVDGGALPGGLGWYKKSFVVPAANRGKKYFIQFDGVYQKSSVYINGKLAGYRPNGYSSFEYDLTPYLNFGEMNELLVKVDNSQQPNSRWYSGSGIYRNVWMSTRDFTHIENWGTYVIASKPVNGSSEITIQTEIAFAKNNKGAENFSIVSSIHDASGKKVREISSQNLKESIVKQSLAIRNPKLWSVNNPYQYKLVSELKQDGKTIDRYETMFGIRSFEFDIDKGFLLNGVPTKIMGVCNHHDLGALGAAINTRALERQLELLKGMGINGIRTSHNMPAPELLDLCDKMGFIVMDESFDMWAKSKTKYDYSNDWKEWHRKDLEDFIRRDRNHASVFIWSVGNEIPEQWGDVKKGDSTGMKISKELVAIVNSLDTTRIITTGNNEVREWNQLINSNAFELIGYNYNHWTWENFKKDHPGKKLIVTESTSALQTRGHYDLVNSDTLRRWPEAWDKPIKGGGNPGNTVSAYDHVSAPWGSTHEESLKLFLKHDFISGMYVWTGFDYLGEPTPYKWPSRSSYFGIIDLAGFPKDVYYLYQSLFTDKPMLHIYPHWNWKQGDTVDVVSYYNKADEVELFLNGQSLGKKKKEGDALHVKWRVPFETGELKAVTFQNGKVKIEKIIRTAGAASQFKVTADRTKINADGKDLSFVTVTITDDKGNKVPRASNLVKFKVEGAGFLRAVDSGDPVSHESFISDQHTALNGLVLGIIQSNGKKGKITVTVTSEGLKSTVIDLEAK
jgi:beta-galactosidase